jgi:hypothetical protein
VTKLEPKKKKEKKEVLYYASLESVNKNDSKDYLFRE